MEYNSPSARFKLTQSAVYNLRDYLSQKMSRPKSSFDKTRSYFENDLFSDNALKELQETNNKPSSDLSGLRFTGFDVGIERIYISTNRDFIISCTKTLKPEKFRKIVFENSKGLFATALKLLWSEEYLIVGFSNGSVVVYNCNQQKPQKYENGPSEDNSACPTPLGEPNKTYQADTGKSCAIQNIVRNERTPYEDRPDSCMTNTRPTTALDGSSKTHASKLFDKQVLLGGTVLRKDLVNTIEVTNDGNRLLALMDGNLRIYDFSTNSEVHCNTSETIVEIGLTKETFCRQNLALLTKDEDVQVHIVK
ncbi:unnamed protein product [Hermetia illucens]|uniref:Uncharacterized protein n=2 Tax=Hermetia illucens TaxID=343691 RepID=A0A7R8UYB2_HERIL|nr:unnamed protein product [Hermetia illucens]